MEFKTKDLIWRFDFEIKEWNLRLKIWFEDLILRLKILIT